MDRISLIKFGKDFWKKYQFPVLILAFGVMLMLLPGRDKGSSGAEPIQTQQTQEDLTGRIEEALEMMDGVGKATVVLTVSREEKLVYEKNESVDADGDFQKEVVIVSGADRTEEGLISQVIPREYQGALIVCQGAENVSVRYQIIQAVAKLTGLGTDRISVVKMK